MQHSQLEIFPAIAMTVPDTLISVPTALQLGHVSAN
jgi:hypothetical protein